MVEQEIWKVYPEIPFIEASNLGRVRTKDRIVMDRNGRKLHIKGRILKQYLNRKDGYMFVEFGMNGKTVHLYVHRIAATLFVPNPNNYPEINHIDCDPTNNRSDNLEWCTHEYNCRYREKYGKARNRTVIAINLDTFEILYFESQKEAAYRLQVNSGYVNKVVKGKRYCKTAGGYWLCYADKTAVEKTRVKFGDEIAEKVEKLIREHL